jgi:hypothetical protein
MVVAEERKKVLHQAVFLRALKLYVFCNKNIKKHEKLGIGSKFMPQTP